MIKFLALFPLDLEDTLIYDLIQLTFFVSKFVCLIDLSYSVIYFIGKCNYRNKIFGFFATPTPLTTPTPNTFIKDTFIS